MGTTANYSWPYPESSDFVADGATAIENLADAADASLRDVADDRGSVWITGHNGSFTTAGITLTNCFNSNFVSYRVVVSMALSTAGGASLSAQLVDSGGTPASGASDYKWGYRYHDLAGGTSADVVDTAHNFWRLGIMDDDWGHADWLFTNPYVASTTTVTFQSVCQGTTFDYATAGGGLHVVNTQYPSLLIIPGGKAGTGRVDVYGLRKAP